MLMTKCTFVVDSELVRISKI